MTAVQKLRNQPSGTYLFGNLGIGNARERHIRHFDHVRRGVGDFGAGLLELSALGGRSVPNHYRVARVQ